MSATSDLSFVDADGHVLEHPSAMQDFAPAAWRERIWHIERDPRGREWMVMDNLRSPANTLSLAGMAGMSAEDRMRALEGKIRYSEIRAGAFDARARLADLDADRIDISVLYPTYLLGIQAHRDVEFAAVQCAAYNDWLADHVADSNGRLFGVAILPQQDLERAAAEIRRVAGRPGIVGVLVRPNPTENWKPLSDRVYDPLWRAASDAGLPIGLHPFLDARLPGACVGLHLNRLRSEAAWGGDSDATDMNIDNVFFSQAIANTVDMMSTMAFLLAGGVCARFPELRVVFLEANGGWVVPWLERLDHHYKVFSWDVSEIDMAPSEYFRRQCWISFDADESTLAFSARSPLCGADRIIWASDYPHPDAKFPGVTAELAETMGELAREDQQRIAGDNARELYGLS